MKAVFLVTLMFFAACDGRQVDRTRDEAAPQNTMVPDSVVAIVTDSDGKTLAVGGFYSEDSFVLVQGPNGAEWRIVRDTDSQPSASDSGWLREPVIHYIAGVEDEVIFADAGGRLVQIGLLVNRVLVADEDGAPIWKQIPGSTSPADGSEKPWLQPPLLLPDSRPGRSGDEEQ